MKKTVIALMLFPLSGMTWAAGFDCAKASTPVEKMICNNPEIDALDDKLNALYREAVKTGDAEKVKQEQRAWLRARNTSQTPQELIARYQERIPVLTPAPVVQEPVKAPEPITTVAAAPAKPVLSAQNRLAYTEYAGTLLNLEMCGSRNLLDVKNPVVEKFAKDTLKGAMSKMEGPFQEEWVKRADASLRDMVTLLKEEEVVETCKELNKEIVDPNDYADQVADYLATVKVCEAQMTHDEMAYLNKRRIKFIDEVKEMYGNTYNANDLNNAYLEYVEKYTESVFDLAGECSSLRNGVVLDSANEAASADKPF